MGNECSRSFDENKQWLKCLVAVNVHIQDALLEVLHDPLRGGIPSDPQELYDFFHKKEQQDKIKELKKKRVLNDNQVALLLPQNQRTFSKKWDTTVIFVVIINFSNLPEPTNGWFQPLDPNDFSDSAFVVVARNDVRNRLIHGTPYEFEDEKIFRPFWSKIAELLKTFKYTKINEFHNLENGKVHQTILMSQIGRIMDEAGGKKDQEKIISEAFKWLQGYNEKCKLKSNLAIFYLSTQKYFLI